VRQVWVYKANQVGFTQFLMALLAYFAVQDPGAAGVLMPDEDSIDELFDEELKPLIKATPETRKLLSGRAWDDTKHELHLATMPILGLYAGSSRSWRSGSSATRSATRSTCTGTSPASRRPRPAADPHHDLGPPRPGDLRQQADDDGRGDHQGVRVVPGQAPVLHAVRAVRDVPRVAVVAGEGFPRRAGRDKFERADHVKRLGQAHYECPNCRKVTEERERMACVRAGGGSAGHLDGEVWKPVQKVTAEGVVTGERPVGAGRVLRLGHRQPVDADAAAGRGVHRGRGGRRPRRGRSGRRGWRCRTGR
jgi:hypothetical protein